MSQGRFQIQNGVNEVLRGYEKRCTICSKIKTVENFNQFVYANEKRREVICKSCLSEFGLK